MDEIEIINNIIKTKMKDSSGALPPKELTHEDISKIIYEEYIGQVNGTVGFFFYSSGKAGNNKPYRLKNVSLDDYIKLKKMVNDNRGAGDIFAIDSDLVSEPLYENTKKHARSAIQSVFSTI